ncbi:MAG TPA: twin-arginine translocase TatA/TatE family subunit [Terriglobia bacterium]|nr:twin-arginine translocase TatA/TatE family subunit [Terriglobia bacterium]
MFTGGFEEIAFVLFIAFLLFGPKKLPEIARVLGKGLGELRRASSELRFSLEDEIRNLDRPGGEATEQKALSPLEELRHTSRELMSTLEDEIRNLERPESTKGPKSLMSSTSESNGPTEATYVHHDPEPAPPKLES